MEIMVAVDDPYVAVGYLLKLLLRLAVVVGRPRADNINRALVVVHSQLRGRINWRE